MSGTRKIVGSAIVAALTLSASGFIAFADDAVADPDVATAGSGELNFGDVCVGTTVSKPVTLVVTRGGGGASAYRNDTPIMVTHAGIDTAGLSATVPATSNTPSNWVESGSTFARLSTVTIVAGSVVRVVDDATLYSLTGINSNQNQNLLTRTASLTVKANVVVCDTTAPTINVPSPIVTEATHPTGATVTYTVTATDEHPAQPAVSCTSASGSVFALGTTTVTCTSTDNFGNSATASFTVTVQDLSPPVISGTPTNLVTEAISAQGATVSFTNPTAVDAVSGPVPATCTPASGSTFPLGTTSVTCSAADAAGNTAMSTFQVVVVDTTSPVLVVPAAMTVEATGPNGADATFTASASDSVSGPLDPVCSPASGSTFALGTTNVECVATDSAGNTASASFAVTVNDTTAPTVSVPASFDVDAVNASGATVTYTSSANDAVSGSLSTSCDLGSGNVFPLGETTVTCTASDAAGNTGSASFVITVTDNDAPTLHLPADVIEEATSPSGNAQTFAATADDNVDVSVAVTCTAVSGSVFPVGTTVVDCTATDVAGNIATGSFSVAIVDTTAPQIETPGDQTTEATGPDGAIVTFDAGAFDVVDEHVATVCTPASGSTFSLGTTSVSCSATDSAGNEATNGFDITVVDTTAPEILGTPDDLTAEATSADGAEVTFSNPTASDLVDGDVTVTCVPPSNSIFPLGTATSVVCTATDAAGNSATSTFLITITDTTAPMLALPEDLIVEATTSGGAIVTFAPTATDVVDGEGDVLCDPPSDTQFALGLTNVACTATDTHGNIAQGGFTVTVQDTTPPTLVVPVVPVVEATGPDGATVTFAVTASDTVDAEVDVICDMSSGDVFPIGSTEVTCTATDDFSNITEDSFQVEVRDSTPPELTVPANITLEATSPTGAVVTYLASATDIVDGTIVPSCSTASGVIVPLGTTTITCNASDTRTNSATAAFTVTVRDTTPPTLELPGSFVVEATGPGGATATFTTTADDIVDGAVTVTCTPPSGTTFALGSTDVSCSAADAATNTASGGFTVTVQDTTPPTISNTPADVTAEASGPAGAVVTYTSPTSFDLVDGIVPVECTPESGSMFPLDASTAVECEATDATGNTSGSVFNIFVDDRTSPVLTLPADFSVEATGPTGALVAFAPSASDLVDGSVAVVCNPATGSVLNIGLHAVGCTVQDAHGNSESGSFTVTVIDTTAPLVVTPANITQEATGPTGASVSYSSIANDIVDGELEVTCSPVSGSLFPLGTTTVTCTATDAAGNIGTATFTVTVRDQTAPQVDQRPDITVDPTGITGAPVSFDAVGATDIVDGALPAVCVPPSGTTFGFGTTIVTCSATDQAGNTGVSTFSVTVRSLQTPGFYKPVDMNGVWNTVKGGSTVPLKFKIFAGATELTSVSAVKSFTQQLVSCAGTSVEDPIDVVTTGGTSLRYDSAGGQFIQNWQTPKKPGACYRVTMTTVDGSTIVANFKLK